jgi:hypothetical protein
MQKNPAGVEQRRETGGRRSAGLCKGIGAVDLARLSGRRTRLMQKIGTQGQRQTPQNPPEMILGKEEVSIGDWIRHRVEG